MPKMLLILNANITANTEHIMPECAIGYKKFDKEMVRSPMILDVFGIIKKVSLKYFIGPFRKNAILNLYINYFNKSKNRSTSK